MTDYKIFHTIFFISVLLLMAVAYPLSGYFQSKKLSRDLLSGFYNKVSWYKASIFWSWIPSILIVIAVLATGNRPQQLGFVMPSQNINEVSSTLYYIAMGASLIYLIYNLYCIASFRYSSKIRDHHAQRVPSSLRVMLPVTVKEKRVWTLLSVTAGITEEIQYRGYLFFAIVMLLPKIHPIALILISTLLFGLGHIYQGKEVIKPVVAGLFLASVFYITGSIYPVILLHIVQDLVAKELLSDKI